MIEINNLTKFAVDKRFFFVFAKIVLKGENRELEDLSIAFVGPEEIKKSNKEYRGKDKPTDVLSFGSKMGFEKDFMEVVICPEVVAKKTNSSGDELKRELAKSLIHGILHNLGYDHERSEKDEEVMEQKQNQYLSKI